MITPEQYHPDGPIKQHDFQVFSCGRGQLLCVDLGRGAGKTTGPTAPAHAFVKKSHGGTPIQHHHPRDFILERTSPTLHTRPIPEKRDVHKHSTTWYVHGIHMSSDASPVSGRGGMGLGGNPTWPSTLCTRARICAMSCSSSSASTTSWPTGTSSERMYTGE